jgi:hypothetical protein
MTKLLKIAAIALPTCAMLALAQPAGATNGASAASSAASPAGAPAKASEPKRVCINLTPDTGSRVTRRMCKTKAEWADEGVHLGSKK